ncbi:BTAD domain-containing putative transcriptional regulator [Dactylosporangium sp. NPDC049140]|uniref:BTAD domain-containing putative transcriptional regulator n=1 Tax=Dactylosporangium sp. NPDC049140 TaxID=3155647 RepID=UPI0033F28C94
MRIGVLGPLWTEVGGVPADAGGPRQRAVLARLVAAGGHVVPTDRFIDDLWQGEPPPKALAALQVYVSNLRRALEPGRAPRTPATVVVSAAPGYALRLPDERVDSWRFEALLRQGSDVAESDPRTADRLLRAALDAWAGPAYAEFADEAWAAPEAARLEGLRLACVEAAGRVALRLGRAALVVPELDRHVQEHPLREEAVHVLASALYRAGRQADALAALRQARERLADELGVDPGPALRALEADVLAHAEYLSADAPIPPSAAEPSPASNAQRDAITTSRSSSGAGRGVEALGRDEELAKLSAAAEAVRRDGLRIVWVGGEAGAGKSTLVRAFSMAMAERGWRVAWGRCPEVDGAPPAWAWTEVLTGSGADLSSFGPVPSTAGPAFAPPASMPSPPLAPSPSPSTPAAPFAPSPLTSAAAPSPLTSASAAAPSPLTSASPLAPSPSTSAGQPFAPPSAVAPSSFAPAPSSAAVSADQASGAEHVRQFGNGGFEASNWRSADATDRRGDGGHFQLAQAVGERLGSGGALLVVLDDVHRADGETLQVLRHVAVALGGRSVLVVATFRTGEDHPQLGAARAALAGPRSMELLLGGLEPDAAARVLAGHLGAPVEAEVAAVVHERTGGNPLFLAEIARLISAEGAGSAVRAIPAGIGHVLRRRLARLPAPAQTVLRHASILGRDVDIDVLAEAFTEDEDAVLDGLEAGVLAGLLEEPGPGRVRFGHALLRDVLYDDMPQLRRRRLHERVLNVLERAAPEDVAALGHHALAAATPASAVRAARHGAAAARQAAGMFAHREAAQLYGASLDALGLRRPGSAEPGDHSATLALDLLCGLTSARANSGDAMGARAARWDAVRAAAQLTGIDLRAFEADTTGGTAREFEAATTGDTAGVIEVDVAGGAGNGATRHPGVAAPAVAGVGRPRTVNVADATGLDDVVDVEPLARALAAFDAPVAWTIRVARYIDRPLVGLLEGVLARADVPARLRGRMLVALVYELEGDELARCAEASAEALRIARAEGDALLLCQALNARYFAVLNPQRRHELPVVGAELLEVAERAGLLGFQAQAHHVLYQAALERNDLRLAQEHLDRALERSTAGQLGVTLSVMAILGAIRAVFAGDHATAERIYTELGERIEAAGQPNATLVGIVGVFFIRLTQGLGHTWLPVLEPLRDLPTAEAEAGEFIARALVDAGRLDEARAAWKPHLPIREDYYWLAIMGLRGENAAALGDVAVAAECYELLRPWAGQFVGLASGTVPGPPVDLVLGRLAIALGQPADAHFEAAKALATRTGATPWM